MVWQYLLTGLALVLVIEGILPFLSPPFWRRVMISFLQRDDRSVRMAGLISMILGALLMYFVHSGLF